ncbi:MAG TPA: hypothetical protein ENF26_03140 [Methanomicrobia archaeon]|nr:hypothetical protein [Methanomicrobia archaeon]HEX59128.1 hypothetical protein [Methanomicrobia archaeon]
MRGVKKCTMREIPYDFISYAYKALEQAKKEFDEYIREREPMKLRDACEKACLSVVSATDYLLVCGCVQTKRQS